MKKILRIMGFAIFVVLLLLYAYKIRPFFGYFV